MIINSIHITVFAGLSGRDIGFEQGMNVVLGPNETGKSTIFRALENTLFTPADLTPSRFQKLMGHYLPIGGGDTIEAMTFGGKFLMTLKSQPEISPGKDRDVVSPRLGLFMGRLIENLEHGVR